MVGLCRAQGIARVIFDASQWSPRFYSSADFVMSFPEISVIDAEIDIYPNRTPNRVFLSRLYTVYVAVLGSASFDVTTLDSTMMRFGKTGAEASPGRAYMLRDLNRDGVVDALYGFLTPDCGFQLGDTEGKLTGSTTDGTPVEGVDSVLVSP